MLIEIEGDRSTQRLLGGEVEEGLRGLTAASTRAQQAGTEHVANETAVNLSDAYIWLLRLPEGIDVGRRAIERALAHGYRDSIEFSTLVVNTIDGLLLSGDPDAAEQLLAPYLLAEVTSNGWPLHIARAELDLLGGDLDGALARIEQLQDMDDYADDEMQMWLGEVGQQQNSGKASQRPRWPEPNEPGQCSKPHSSPPREPAPGARCPSGRGHE